MFRGTSIFFIVMLGATVQDNIKGEETLEGYRVGVTSETEVQDEDQDTMGDQSTGSDDESKKDVLGKRDKEGEGEDQPDSLDKKRKMLPPSKRDATLPPPPSNTLYLGGINGPGAKQYNLSTPLLGITDICTHVKGMGVCKGPLLAIRLMPEKSCVFLDFSREDDAIAFFTKCYGGSEDPKEFYHLRRIINVAGIELRVGWAKQTYEQPNIAIAVKNGATRCVYLHPVEPKSELLLEKLFTGYGAIDCIKIVEEKTIAFVHMASIQSAMQAVSAIGAKRLFRKVSFAADRVCLSSSRGDKNQSKTDGKQSIQTPPIPSKTSAPPELRTVFLGGLPKECTLNDVCNNIRAGGPLLSIRISKGSAFVTFVETQAAQCFYDFVDRYGIVLEGRRLSVGWAKPNDSNNNRGTNTSGLSPAITSMLRQGATRNLCVLNLDSLDAHQLSFASNNATQPMYTNNDTYHAALEQYFSSFGTIECINIAHTKGSSGDRQQRAAFINFSSIMEAARALEAARRDARFDNCRLCYGKDRCSQPLLIQGITPSSTTLPNTPSNGSVSDNAPFYYEDSASFFEQQFVTPFRPFVDAPHASSTAAPFSHHSPMMFYPTLPPMMMASPNHHQAYPISNVHPSPLAYPPMMMYPVPPPSTPIRAPSNSHPLPSHRKTFYTPGHDANTPTKNIKDDDNPF